MNARGHLIGTAIILAAALVAAVVIVRAAHVPPPPPSHRCPCAVPYATPSAP